MVVPENRAAASGRTRPIRLALTRAVWFCHTCVDWSETSLSLEEDTLAEVGAYQAKTHFAALLDRVEKGEHIAITRHGRVVAVLTPPADTPDRTVAETVSDILAFRKGRRLGPRLTIRDLIDSGRR